MTIVAARRCCPSMACKTENPASIDDQNDADSVSKEIINTLDETDDSSEQQQQQNQQRVPPTYVYSPPNCNGTSESSNGEGVSRPRNQATDEQLGPLPPNWEKAYTETGEAYFIDHNTGTSHWLDPRLSKFQKRSLEECRDDELPYGWEKIDDTLYGTYFIDHVNRRTQYENPVIQAKRALQNAAAAASGCSDQEVVRKFTRNPEALEGQRLRTTLLKGSRGLGITIVGADDNAQEFLQIKSIVPNGPAWLDGKLQTGDVLVYVNDICVLGLTHNEMVNVFKSIGTGQTVVLEVCRGYPLPFDPNDPNNEVVTTIAVNTPDILADEPSLYMDLNRSNLGDGERFDFLENSSFLHNGTNGVGVGAENMTTTNQSSVNSMPDLCISEKLGSVKRPSSTDILLDDHNLDQGHPEDSSSPLPSSPKTTSPEFLSVPIVKGAMGFGFTIADSAYGQKVKKILDRQRCKSLSEGDILVTINDVTVRNMNHNEVVQVLKDCPRNQAALIHVQRSSNIKNSKSPQLNGGKPSTIFDAFRSRTPTADIYSTQVKTVVPLRSKTPLIDTRPCAERAYVTNNGHLSTSNDYSNVGLYDYSHLGMPENFGTLSIDTEDSMRDCIKQQQEDWLSNGVDSIYGVTTHHHNLQQPPQQPPQSQGSSICKNGMIHPVSDYYQYPPFIDRLDYASYALLGQEQNVDTGEIWDKRNQTTSFEHEQPLSNSLLNSYARYGNVNDNDLVCPMIPDIEWIETLVTLVRQESGFGFRIVGGTEEGSQISVGHIVPGGAADLDGRLNSGDLIMSVDGESVMNSSHQRVVELMITAAQNGRVTLGIRRRVNAQELSTSSYSCPTIQYPYEVTVTRMENEGFGFVIISSVNKAGSTIGRIIEGSPAERCGRLNVGDHILAVNHMDISNLCHKDIVNLIKDSGYSVTLTIGYPLDDCCSNTSMSQKDEVTGDGEYHGVDLTRGNRGFGFSIRGGREFQNMPLFVLQIAENGPASIDNRLRVGDQIIEINGINTKNMTHTEAIEIIRNGGPTVRLLIKRGGQIPSVVGATSLYDMNI